MAVSLPARTALQQSIVDLLRKRGNRLLSIREIDERLRDPEVTRDDIQRAIEELEREGIILAVRGKRYSLLEFTPYHAGRIKVHPDGYGTIFGGDQQPDIYIDRRAMKGAMNGDLVVVRVDKKNPNYRRLHNRDLFIGEISQVLRRAHRTVVGRFHDHPRDPFVVPFDTRLDHDVLIGREETMGAREPRRALERSAIFEQIIPMPGCPLMK